MPPRKTTIPRFKLFTAKPVATDGRGKDMEPTFQPTAKDLSHGTCNSRVGIRSQLRRSGAKVLSKLGFWSSGVNDPALDDVSKITTLAATTVLGSGPIEQPISTVHWDEIFPIDCSQQGNGSEASSAQSSTCLDKVNVVKTAEMSTHHDDGMRAKDHEIGTLPALPARFPRKLSVFGPCTVIHRTKAKSRIRILNTDGPHSLISFSRSDNITQGSTDRSTCISTIFSQTSCSSSLDGVPSSALLSAPEALRSVRVPQYLTSQCCSSSPPSFPPFKLQPSIVTVEAAAAAKIFLETHFNTVLLGRDSRALRLRELQEHLYALPFTDVERRAAKQAWLAQESEYLRQTRVLKSYSNRFDCKETISAAGFETVKLLGQGSFGVVRLVRDKHRKDTTTVNGQGTDLEADGVRDDPSLCQTPKHTPRHACPTKRTSPRSDNIYAMKIIRKADMIHLCQEGHIRAEREFLASSERSKWIVPLIASFQDTSHLYLIMEYEVGGDFFGLLLRQGVLSERDTVWYIAEMILCVEEAHRLGWIHRDVKPENFLISSSGHLKLGDFGLAFDGHWSHNQDYFHNHRYSLLNKLGIEIEGDTTGQSSDYSSAADSSMKYYHGCVNQPSKLKAGERVLDWRDRNERRRLAHSIVGTSQYMAPEIIAGEPYDGRCDYWSIGIILFECLYGMTPFYRDNRDDTKRCILHHRTTLYFPQERFSDLVISLHAIDLIQQLLQIKEFRLSSKQYKINDCFLWSSIHNTIYANALSTSSPYYKGHHVYPDDASDIKTHRFFRDIPWNEMLAHRPPYIPNVENSEDSKDFGDGCLSGTTQENPQITQSESQSSISYLDFPTAEDTSSSSSHPATAVCKGTANENHAEVDSKENSPKRNGKDNKRPRDKILRDTKIGPTALNLRTKKAFVGYTWRRPTPVTNVLQTTRGRSLFSHEKTRSLEMES